MHATPTWNIICYEFHFFWRSGCISILFSHLHWGMVEVGVHWPDHSQVIEMDWLVDDPDPTNSFAKPHSYSR